MKLIPLCLDELVNGEIKSHDSRSLRKKKDYTTEGRMRRSSRGCRSGAAAKKENSMWTVVVQLRGTRALPLKGSIGLQLGLQLPTGGRFFLQYKTCFIKQ